ncbi:hypothetical protein [Sorangium sp. So ce854]|uniref:hypothetical protein n=1 Tax=Sorangium sp. So ce854 TaxID=3133322 RepID=UPI003F606BD2
MKPHGSPRSYTSRLAASLALSVVLAGSSTVAGWDRLARASIPERPPEVTTRWHDWPGLNDQLLSKCTIDAEKALKIAGFPDPDTFTASRGAGARAVAGLYVTYVRCIKNRGVIFVAAGPDQKAAEKYAYDLEKFFQ